MKSEPFNIQWGFLIFPFVCLIMLLYYFYVRCLLLLDTVRRYQTFIHNMASFDSTVYTQCLLLLDPMYMIRMFVQNSIDDTMNIEPNV